MKNIFSIYSNARLFSLKDLYNTTSGKNKSSVVSVVTFNPSFNLMAQLCAGL